MMDSEARQDRRKLMAANLIGEDHLERYPPGDVAGKAPEPQKMVDCPNCGEPFHERGVHVHRAYCEGKR